MKLAVFSDTHGRTAGMLSAAKRIRPDVFVHLGDHIRDSLELAHEFPDTPLYAVAGNCDFSSKEPDRMTFLIGTTTVFATHGHGYAVKYTMEPLLNAGHFAEDTDRAFIDVFSCREFPPEDTARYCKEYFGAKTMEYATLFRNI